MRAPGFFYVGTFSPSAEGGGIYAGTLDLKTGKLGPLSLAAKAEKPGFLALSPDGKFLHATVSDNKVAAYAVGEAGELTPLNECSSGGDDTCHVCTDRTGRFVFVANYGSGSVACFRVQPDGSLGERTALVRYAGSGPHPERQQKPYAHSIYTDLENRFVYSCDLGTDNVWIFKFDPADGTLTPAVPPSGKVPPGSGPRHLAFHPDGFAYVANEMGISVTAFQRDSSEGALRHLETVPAGAPDKSATLAGIFCHPTGKWLYVSNRGPDTITVYAIRPDGTLERVQEAPAQVKVPRGFGIDPAGRWLLSAGQDDNRIAVLKIDQQTGTLTFTGQTAEVVSPVCVVFAPKAG